MKILLKKDYVADSLEERAAELTGAGRVLALESAAIMRESLDPSIIGVDEDPLED